MSRGSKIGCNYHNPGMWHARDQEIVKEAGIAFQVQRMADAKAQRWEWLRFVLETLKKTIWQELSIKPGL